MTEIEHGGRAIQKGLIYHFHNYSNLENEIIKYDILNDINKLRPIIDNLNHETIAFFNRMGQFYYYAKSDKIKEVIDDYELVIPSILKFLPFRMKQSAHRATDYPHKSDLPELILLDRLFTWGFILNNNRLHYQMRIKSSENEESTLFFEMLNEGQTILNEVNTFMCMINTRT